MAREYKWSRLSTNDYSGVKEGALLVRARDYPATTPRGRVSTLCGKRLLCSSLNPNPSLSREIARKLSKSANPGDLVFGGCLGLPCGFKGAVSRTRDAGMGTVSFLCKIIVHFFFLKKFLYVLWIAYLYGYP